MNRKLVASVSGVLVSLALIAAGPAGAVAPPSVFMRAEGASATLLAQTLVQTTSGSTVQGKPCPGTSAGGALDIATAGSWSGSYSTKFKDYLVGTILGESATGNNFWTLWVNGRSSSTGACSTRLHPGDHELWFDCVADASFNCTNNPLKLTTPALVRLGRAFTASVVQLDGSGHSSPVAAAAVTGRGAAAVSHARGRARIVPHKVGVVMLQASKSGATASDPVFTCVYRRLASECGSVANGPPVHVIGIHEHQLFATGPRELHGTAGPDPSGLTDVGFGLLRHAPNGRCSYYDANRAGWRSIRCAAKAPRFSIGANASWSYLLPAPLRAGRYTLDVIASDGNGRRTKLVTGSSALDFSVA